MEILDHVSLVGLSDHARIVICTCVSLQSLGLYTCDNMEKALTANGMSLEEIQRARREALIHMLKGGRSDG